MVEGNELESSFAEKDLVVLVENMNHQHALQQKRPMVPWAALRKALLGRSRVMILLLCFVLMGTQLEHCVQFWASQYKTDMDILD